jgi:hypothetical protein
METYNCSANFFDLFCSQVILSVIGLIALAVVIMTPADSGPRFPGRKIQLEDLLSRHFKPRKFNGTWISGEHSILKILLDYLEERE